MGKYRIFMRKIAFGLFPFVILTGLLTVATKGGNACNTFPKVGSNWWYNKNNFFDSRDKEFWKNFTENGVVTQVNHRSLGTLMALLVSV